MRARTASMAKWIVYTLSTGTPSSAVFTSSVVMASASSNVHPSSMEHTTLAHPVTARQPRVLKPARTNVRVSGSITANRRSATSPRFDLPTMLWALNPSGAPPLRKFATTDSSVSE